MHEKYLKSARWKRRAAIFCFVVAAVNVLVAIISTALGNGGAVAMNLAAAVFATFYATDSLRQSRNDRRCAELEARRDAAYANRNR